MHACMVGPHVQPGPAHHPDLHPDPPGKLHLPSIQEAGLEVCAHCTVSGFTHVSHVGQVFLELGPACPWYIWIL